MRMKRLKKNLLMKKTGGHIPPLWGIIFTLFGGFFFGVRIFYNLFEQKPCLQSGKSSAGKSGTIIISTHNEEKETSK